MKKIDDATFRRMRESYSSKKTLKIKDVAASSKRTKKTKKKHPAPSQEVSLVGASGSGGTEPVSAGTEPVSAGPVVIPDIPIRSEISRDEPIRSDSLPPVPSEPEEAPEADHPLKRARVDRSSEKRPVVSQPSPLPVIHSLGQGLVRDLVTPPEGCSFSTASLDSLRYRGVDLAPFITDRLALKKDIDENFALLNKYGGMKWGKMVVSDLSRVLLDALSLLPLISKQEKLLAKYQKFDLEKITRLQADLDQARSELAKYQGFDLEKVTQLQTELDQARSELAKYRGFDPEEVSRLRSELDRAREEFSLLQGSLDKAIGAADSFKKEAEALRSAKELQDVRLDEVLAEKAKLLEEISKKDALIASLQEDVSSKEKMVEEARSAERLVREELKDSDANAY